MNVDKVITRSDKISVMINSTDNSGESSLLEMDLRELLYWLEISIPCLNSLVEDLAEDESFISFFGGTGKYLILRRLLGNVAETLELVDITKIADKTLELTSFVLINSLRDIRAASGKIMVVGLLDFDDLDPNGQRYMTLRSTPEFIN